jgi:hypothetical protein
MASLQRCNQGHFFDPKLDAQCPLCNSSDPVEVTIRHNPKADIAPSATVEDLLVGWLVNVATGQHFSLRGERSFIGSSVEMDVRLLHDDKVLAKHHASITFDSKRLRFTLTAGPEGGYISLNDASMVARSIQELAAHDIVEIGRSKLVFLPLCGERFQWTQ